LPAKLELNDPYEPWDEPREFAPDDNADWDREMELGWLVSNDVVDCGFFCDHPEPLLEFLWRRVL
jgi:hypothetical protein